MNGKIEYSLFTQTACTGLANHVSHVTLFREHSDAMPLNNYGRQLTQKLTSLNDKRHTGNPRLKDKRATNTFDVFVHFGLKEIFRESNRINYTILRTSSIQSLCTLETPVYCNMS